MAFIHLHVDVSTMLTKTIIINFRTKQKIAEIIAAHQEVTEKSKREEQWQMEKLRSAILQMKREHSEEVQALKK